MSINWSPSEYARGGARWTPHEGVMNAQFHGGFYVLGGSKACSLRSVARKVLHFWVDVVCGTRTTHSDVAECGTNRGPRVECRSSVWAIGSETA